MHCIFFKFCAKFFRPNEVLDVPVAWEELPFGKCDVVPGQVDQSTTNDWESFLISPDYMNSFMYASKLVPWTILIRGRGKKYKENFPWDSASMEIFYLEPDTPDFSAHILTSIVRMEKEVHNLLTKLDTIALEEPNEVYPQCKSTSRKRKVDSEIQLLTHKRLWKNYESHVNNIL